MARDGTVVPTAAVGDVLKKKTAAARSWILLDSTGGDGTVLDADKYAIMHRVQIHARDLRILDPLLSYPSTILGRERAIVLNLEHIKAIITAEEVLLRDPTEENVIPVVEELRRRLPAANMVNDEKNTRFGTKAIKGKGDTKGIKAWTGMSHGHHMVEKEHELEGYVLAQREQVEDSEVWLFGTFDQRIGARFTKYLQTYLFENKLSKYQMERQVKQIMKRAYLSTKANIGVGESTNEVNGFATALVMNSEKFVVAYIGKYKVVACMDGMATQMGGKDMKRKGKWQDFKRMNCVPKDAKEKPHCNSKLIICTQKVEPNTSFIILASDGVWEVMRNQEAVDLVYHIEDAQAAAEFLAEEALNRMSKSVISCIVIRFH